MKKIFLLTMPVLLVLATFSGCAQKAQTSEQAIQQSQALKTVDEQVNYLVGQANNFLNSKEFDQAIATAKYVLSNLDANSQEAKSIIEKAKESMQKMAEGAVADMKNKIGSIGQ